LAASLPERIRDLQLLENTYYRAMQDIDRRTQEHLQLLLDTIDQQEKWLDDLDSDLRDFRIEVMSRFTKSIEHSEKGKETRQIPFGLYADLEEAFRGSREDIISRLKTYLPLLQESMTATQNAPVVDLGSGRGEWLELCAQEGVKALGIDFNPLFVKQCREKGLTIQESDVFEFLDATEKNSLGLVTAFHLIEHLSPLRLAVFVEQVHRALAPGGIAIFETPNPENVLVGSHNFYVDPTHGNPIPPVTAAFLLERCGFEQVKIERLHPDERRSFSDEELNQLLRGPQDYAVIGYKGTSAS
jgi:O-antigen chain-terminating methyltransferase